MSVAVCGVEQGRDDGQPVRLVRCSPGYRGTDPGSGIIPDQRL